jgi:hypothetical protein
VFVLVDSKDNLYSKFHVPIFDGLLSDVNKRRININFSRTEILLIFVIQKSRLPEYCLKVDHLIQFKSLPLHCTNVAPMSEICNHSILNLKKLKSIAVPWTPMTYTYFHDLCVWLQTGFGLVSGFIDHLHTTLVTTSNYSANKLFPHFTNQHTLSLLQPSMCSLVVAW